MHDSSIAYANAKGSINYVVVIVGSSKTSDTGLSFGEAIFRFNRGKQKRTNEEKPAPFTTLILVCQVLFSSKRKHRA